MKWIIRQLIYLMIFISVFVIPLGLLNTLTQMYLIEH